MALNVGGVVANLGARLDPSGFDRFDQRVDRAQRGAAKPVELELGADVNESGFSRWTERVTRSRRERPVDVPLGADVDESGFEAYRVELAKVRAQTKRREDYKAKLGADFDEGAFRAFERASAQATKSAGALASAAGGVGGAGGGGASGALGTLGKAGPAAAAGLLVAIPVVVSLGGALIALTSTLAAAAAGAAAVGAGIGAALLPIGGLIAATVSRVSLVGEAYKALQAQSDGAGAAATAQAGAQTAATAQIKSAQQGLADSNRGVAVAQENLTAARFRARREVEDLTRAVGASALTEERASITLQRAIQRLAELEADPRAARLDLQDARLAIREAKAGLRDATTQRNRALTDAKRGTDTLTDAERSLAEARRGSARAADQVAAAQASAAQATSQQSAAATAAELALSKLTATERRLLTTFQGFSKAARAAVSGATDAIVGGLGGALDALTPRLASYRTGLTGLGTAIGDTVRGAGEALAGPQWTGAIQRFIATAQRIVKPVSSAIGSVFVILRNIADAARPLVIKFVDALDRGLGGLAGKTNDVGKLTPILAGLAEHTESFGRFLGSVGRLLLSVFRGGATEGKGLLDSITAVLNRTADFLNTDAGQDKFREFIRDSVRVTKDFLKAVGRIIGAVIRISNALIELNDRGGRAFRDFRLLLGELATQIRSDFRDTEDRILGFVTTALGAVSTLATGLGRLPGGGRFKAIAKGIDEARDSLDKYRESLRRTSENERFEDSVKRQTAKVEDLTDKLGKARKGSDKYRDTQRELNRAQRGLNTTLIEGEAAGGKIAGGLRKAAAGADSAANAAQGAGVIIAGSYNALASQFAIPPVKFKAERAAALKRIGDVTKDVVFATGGIPNPGSGARDDHYLIDPSGRPVAALSGTEGILNTPQMREVDQALSVTRALGLGSYGGLDELWGSGMRHYAAGGSLQGANPGMQVYADKAARYDLSVTDGRRPAGTQTANGNVSQHSTGDAIDVGGPVARMLDFARDLVRQSGRGADQIIHTPLGFGINNGARVPLAFFGPKTNAMHFNHVHIGDSTPPGNLGGGSPEGRAGDGGGSAPRLRSPRITGPGAMRRLLQRSADRQTRGAQKRLDRAAGAAGGVSAAEAGAGAQGAEANVVAAFRRAISIARASPVERLALFEAGIVESGLRNLPYGDRDSLGALQERTSIYGKAHALNPLASALRFLREARPKRPWRGSAGRLAQAVQRSAFPDRYDQVRGQAQRYLATGGRLNGAGVPRFAGGGRLPASVRKRLRIPTTGPQSNAIRPLLALSTDRIESYDAIRGDVDDLNTRYSLTERRYNLTEEELIRPDGTLDEGAVRQKGSELAGLIAIRRRIAERLEAARAMARRIAQTYTAIIGRLKRARKAAKKKDRPGYTARIETYTERLNEWKGTGRTISLDTLPNARLDLEELIGERNEVLGTKAAPVEASTGAEGDLGEGASPGDDGGTPGGDPATPEQAPPDPAEVARQALEQVAAFTAARSELQTSFGSNFVTAAGDTGGGPRGFGAGGVATAQDAGAGSVLAQSGGGDQSGRSVTVVNNFAAPPPDPHTWSAGVGFELANV